MKKEHLQNIIKIIQDNNCYGETKPTVAVVEIMGRHAGWLTAGAALAKGDDCCGADAIYLPEETFDLEEAEKLEKKLRKQEFDLDDYLAQLRQMKKMGSFSSILKMIPGMNKFGDIKVDDKEFVKIEAIICSMTKAEKKNTKLLNASRRQRIAKGSGTKVQDINKFISSFEMTQKLMKKMQNNKGGMKNMMKNLDMNSLKGMKF